MLTTRNSAATGLSSILLALLALLLAGCQPSGPKSLLLGEKYIAQGDYNRALRHLTRASTLMQENPQVWNHLGLAYHGLNQPVKASEAYQRAIRINRKVPAPHFNLGVLLLEQQHPAHAAAALSTFVSIEPEHVAGWVKLGTAFLRLKRPDDAENALNRALLLDAKNPEAHNGMGLVHVQRKRYRDALLAFNSALEYSPGFSPALLNQAVVADEYFNNPKLAIERYRAYLSTNPDTNTVALINQAIEVLQAKADATAQLARAVEEHARQAAAAPATNPPTQVAVTNSAPVGATNLAATTRPQATNTVPAIVTNVPANVAINVATSIVTEVATNLVAAAPGIVTNLPVANPSTNPATASTNRVAFVAAQTNAPPAPPATITEAAPEPDLEPVEVEVVQVESFPEFRVPSDVAPAPTALPATNEALAAQSSPVEPQPLIIPRRDRREEERPGLLSRVNPTRWFRGDDDAGSSDARPTTPAARSAYNPAAAAPRVGTSSTPRVIPRYAYRRNLVLPAGNRPQAERLFRQGAQAHAVGQLNDAMEFYRDAIAVDPSYFDAHYNLALAAYRSKDLPVALAANEQAVLAQPASREARFNFAITLREANYPADAAAELNRLLQSQPEDSRAHLVLANLYAAELNEPALARQHFSTVLDLNPAHPEASAIRQWIASNR